MEFNYINGQPLAAQLGSPTPTPFFSQKSVISDAPVPLSREICSCV